MSHTLFWPLHTHPLTEVLNEVDSCPMLQAGMSVKTQNIVAAVHDVTVCYDFSCYKLNWTISTVTLLIFKRIWYFYTNHNWFFSVLVLYCNCISSNFDFGGIGFFFQYFKLELCEDMAFQIHNFKTLTPSLPWNVVFHLYSFYIFGVLFFVNHSKRLLNKKCGYFFRYKI